jgi:hypothetical protein
MTSPSRAARPDRGAVDAKMKGMSEPDVPEDLPEPLEHVGPTPTGTRPDCGRCDCADPSECLYGPREVERASFALVWIVGAAAVALVALLVVVFLAVR